MARIFLRLTFGLILVFTMLLSINFAVARLLPYRILAFSAGSDIWLTDLTVGTIRKIVLNRGQFGQDDQLSWSPDGNQLVFMALTNDYDSLNQPSFIYNITVLNLASGQERILHSTVSSNDNWDDSPVWSPDGTSIVFSSRTDYANQVTIYLIPVDAPEEMQLLYSTSNKRIGASARWSRDGKSLTLDGESENGGVVIVRVAVPTGEVQTILPRTAYYPHFAPDGETLAMWMPALEGYALAIWRDGMLFPQPLTESYPNPLPFTWSSDGMLTLAVRNTDGGGLLLSIDPETGDQTPLFQFTSRILGLAWLP